ncbi:MAG: Fe-S cluster assembly sulfur transfer protein SufU [Myxococcota bacterium]
MSDLHELYREVILDHSRHPRNRGTLKEANRRAEGFNPLCGDRVTIQLVVDEDEGVVRDVMFDGEGCAISTAAASTLTEAVRGRSVEEVEAVYQRFHGVVTGEEPPENLADEGKLAAFAGVAAFPMRVKCATLAWHALHEALEGGEDVATTE